MEPEFDVQVGAKDTVKEQQQDTKAKIAWIVMLFTTPVLSPLLLIYLLIVQFCLVGRQNLSPQAMAVTAVLAIFFAIAWIPPVAMILYWLDPTGFIQDQINAFAPIGAFTCFCVWGTFVAFRHFSIADSYEPEFERSSVKKLERIAIDPPLVVFDENHVPSSLKELQAEQEANQVVEPGGSKRFGLELTNGLQLYQALKGDLHHTYTGTFASLVLSAATVTLVRMLAVTDAPSPSQYSSVLYWLSTAFFSGMFLVFYSTFAYIIIVYIHQVNFIRRLTYSMDDSAPPRQRVVRVEAMHLQQLRAWEECRRLAVEELTSPRSILNAIFTPSMWLSALGTIGSFVYLVARLLFQNQTASTVSFAVASLLVSFLGFTGCAIGVAKVAQKHFKRHSALVAHKTFEVARQIDLHHTNLDQGIEDDDETASVGVRRIHKVVQHIHHSHSRASASGQQVSSSADSREHVSLVKMEQIYASLHSLCTFIIANQPRPLILGIELRHVRFVVVFVLLLSGNVLFVSLMIAFKQNKCGIHD